MSVSEDNATIDFNLPKESEVVSASDPRIIKVIGVGGGGGNAVARMYEEGLHNVRFEVCNTDRMDLERNPVPIRRQLGSEGLGTGSNPEKARKIAEDSLDEIHKMFCDGTRMVFITAGMGGGTGTGAAPVIAREAKKAGMLTVGIVTIPFAMERELRIDRALDGVYELSKYVDSMLVINNERLCEICAFKTWIEALRMSDDTLFVAVKSIADIITTPMHWNLDFNDVNTVLKNGGIALISTGEAEGENRVSEAIKNAIESPLLNDNDIFNARRATIAIYTSDKNEESITMQETGELHEFMDKFVNREFDTKLGLAYVPEMGGKIRVTILASGFGLATQPYVSDDMRQELPAETVGADVESPEVQEVRNRRREIFYPKVMSKQRRSHLVYRFSDSDLDNEDVIDMVSDSNTQSRRYETLKNIQRQSDDYTGAESHESAEEAYSGSADGKIYFGN